MKIILSPDKFKGSLTGLEFCAIAEKGIKNVIPKADFIWMPLADGGDGTIEVVDYYLKSKKVDVEVNNPFFNTIKASYLYSEHSHTAFIEMAEASGYKVLDKAELDCKNATTFGTGQLIVDALERGAKTILLGIGGSATNDCGVGMATALGYRFLDAHGDQVHPIGANLSSISKIDDSGIHHQLNEVSFKVACDVNNPLYGPNGAARVYGPQKGATPADVDLLDKGLKDFSTVVDEHFKVKSQEIKGAGAAGGMGIGTLVFLDADLIPGISLIKDIADYDEKIANADWIVTGEGMMDSQTLSGKVIKGITDSARRNGIKVAALCGQSTLDGEDERTLGLSHVDTVMHRANSLEDALHNSKEYLLVMAQDFARKITDT